MRDEQQDLQQFGYQSGLSGKNHILRKIPLFNENDKSSDGADLKNKL